MELIVGIIIIFILLFCLGASINTMITVALGIVCLFIVFMTAVFIYATIILLTGKRTKGIFTRAEKDEKGRIPYAYYLIDGTEYKNLFPLEVMFQSKIYRTDREVKLILNIRRKRCFDNNAVICCILGIIVSIFLVAWTLIFILGNV